MHHYALIFRLGTEWHCHPLSLTAPLSENSYEETIRNIIAQHTARHKDTPSQITLFAVDYSPHGTLTTFKAPLAHYATLPAQSTPPSQAMKRSKIWLFGKLLVILSQIVNFFKK